MWKKLSIEDKDSIKEFADIMENYGCRKNSLKLKIDESVIKHNLTIPNTDLFLFKDNTVAIGLGFRYNENKDILQLIYISNKILRDDIEDYDREYAKYFKKAAIFVKNYLKGKKAKIVFGGSGDPTEVHRASFLTRPEWRESLPGLKIRETKFKKGEKIINSIEVE